MPKAIYKRLTGNENIDLIAMHMGGKWYAEEGFKQWQTQTYSGNMAEFLTCLNGPAKNLLKLLLHPQKQPLQVLTAHIKEEEGDGDDETTEE